MAGAAEAERAVLGSMLLSREAAEACGAELRPEDFGSLAARVVFTAMQGLLGAGQAVDTVTVLAALQREGSLDSVGGAPYIARLGVEVPSAANARHYVDIVQDASRRRTLVAGLREAEKAAQAGEADYIGLAQEAVEAARAIGSGGAAPVGREALDAVERIGQRDAAHPTGFGDLDWYLGGGLHDGDLIILGARPSMGKTALALNLALHAALAGEAVAVVTLEMTKEQLLQRAAFCLAGVDAYSAARGIGAQRLIAAAERLSKTRLYVFEPPGPTPQQVQAACYRVRQREKRLGLVVVDYLQLMETRSRKNSSRAEDVAEVSRAMKRLAKALRCPVLALSQLNRALEGRANKRPMLADLRESGALEQDADVVGLLHRPGYGNPQADQGAAERILAKNRNGATDTLALIWEGKYMRFSDPNGQGWAERETQTTWEDLCKS